MDEPENLTTTYHIFFGSFLCNGKLVKWDIINLQPHWKCLIFQTNFKKFLLISAFMGSQVKSFSICLSKIHHLLGREGQKGSCEFLQGMNQVVRWVKRLAIWLPPSTTLGWGYKDRRKRILDCPIWSELHKSFLFILLFRIVQFLTVGLVGFVNQGSADS